MAVWGLEFEGVAEDKAGGEAADKDVRAERGWLKRVTRMDASNSATRAAPKQSRGRRRVADRWVRRGNFFSYFFSFGCDRVRTIRLYQLIDYLTQVRASQR